MANGYERGDYLGRFLAQLPQIYQMQQNAQLQRERFEYMKEEGINDEIYRGQVISANEERNRLAREQFEERKAQNKIANQQAKDTKDHNDGVSRRADLQITLEGLERHPELIKDILLNQPSIKGNSELTEAINNSFKLRAELDDRINAAAAMSPELRLEEYRKIRLDTNLSEGQRDYIDGRMDKAMEESTVTLAELEQQPAHNYYVEAKNRFKQISATGRKKDPLNPTRFIETEEEFQSRRKDALDMMFDYEDMAREQERAARGVYPGLLTPSDEEIPMYDNIDEIPESDIDAILGDLGSETIESNALPPEFAPAATPSSYYGPYPTTTPTPAPEEDISQAPSAYTGSDAKQKSDVDFFFGLLKDGEISLKRFMESIKKANVNVQSIDLSMVYKHKGKAPKKELSKNQQRSIEVYTRRIEEINKRNFSLEEKESKINKLKKKILNIDPNYKFKD